MTAESLYFNEKGEECDSVEGWVARKVEFSDSGRYFIRADRVTRKLFNPNIDRVIDIEGKRSGRPIYNTEEVSSTCFRDYLEFLGTHNDLMYNKANTYRR